jgi:hypothetical protein
MAENSKKQQYNGLWYNGNGWYNSYAFSKKALAELLENGGKKRLIVRHNKYWKEGSNTPRFVFAFVDADKAENIIENAPYLNLEDIASECDDGTLYVTVDEAIDYARRGAVSIQSGYDEYDVYCRHDLEGQTLTELIIEKAKDSD